MAERSSLPSWLKEKTPMDAHRARARETFKERFYRKDFARHRGSDEKRGLFRVYRKPPGSFAESGPPRKACDHPFSHRDSRGFSPYLPAGPVQPVAFLAGEELPGTDRVFAKRVWIVVPLFTGVVVFPGLFNVVRPGTPLLVLFHLGGPVKLGFWKFPAEVAITRKG